jgi:hypothetical protein
MRPYSKKYLKAKRAGGISQVKEHLPSKRKALSSNPETSKEPKMSKLSIWVKGIWKCTVLTL